VGDAVCSFNPIYGQGMSVAALEALALRRHLRRSARPEPRRLLRDLARAVDVPWEIAAGGDLVFPGVQGHRTAKTRLANAYLARLHAAAADDGRLAVAFAQVAGLVAPPQSLLRPGVALRVLRGNLGAISKKSESHGLSTLAAPVTLPNGSAKRIGRMNTLGIPGRGRRS
jgi:hypothetical protein